MEHVHLKMIFPLKPPFIGNLPLPRLMTPEGAALDATLLGNCAHDRCLLFTWKGTMLLMQMRVYIVPVSKQRHT